MNSACLLTLACASLSITAAVDAEEWGDLTGTIVLGEGAEIPKQAPITATKDPETCGACDLKDESVVVNADNRGIADILVYIYPDKGTEPPVHPDYAKTADAEVSIDNKCCRYEPRVVLLRTTQTLVIGNKDNVGHNTKIDTFANPAINPIIPAGSELKQKFPAAEKRPSAIGCNIHPWMTATLLVQDHPYMAVTDENGTFTIKDLPAGSWTFQFRHATKGYLREVSVDNKTEKWSKGRTKLEIKAGENDMGKITIPKSVAAKLFD